MQSFNFKTAGLGTLAMLTLIFGFTTDAESAAMKVVATDIVYGGAAGALVATGVSLLQDDPDWTKNLRRGTGIGIILGLGFGIYDGFVLRPSQSNRRALLTIESRQFNWSMPQIAITSSPFINARVRSFDFRLDALRYRF